MEDSVTFRHNVISITNVDSFFNIKGRYSGNTKDVYFIRCLGMNDLFRNNYEAIEEKYENTSIKDFIKYHRIEQLDSCNDIEKINAYNRIYYSWIKFKKIELLNCKVTEKLEKVINNALEQVIELYRNNSSNITKTMEKNFAVKIFFWLDNQFKFLLNNWDIKRNEKIVTFNILKTQQYLFFYLLTLLGYDVILFQIKQDVEIDDKLKMLSQVVKIGEYGSYKLPKYEKPINDSAVVKKVENATTGRVKVVLPERRRAKTNNSNSIISGNRTKMTVYENTISQEKTFEELALLAESIVMIEIHNYNGDIIGTGSGIMIGKNGYILTNNHVAKDGAFFSVRIEDDDEIYTTDEVIKYNHQFDLAIIRINRKLKPLRIYKGSDKLVRGQKVVAIGSPLGLFNSVSDGIISGFRTINYVDMIQFTAPISHGSSGGAVLNMNGEIIGISTAGIDSGQNINLAVEYSIINDFVRGFSDI